VADYIYVDPAIATANVLRIGSQCYRVVGPSERPPDTFSVDSAFDDCETCLSCCEDVGDPWKNPPGEGSPVPVAGAVIDFTNLNVADPAGSGYPLSSFETGGAFFGLMCNTETGIQQNATCMLPEMFDFSDPDVPVAYVISFVQFNFTLCRWEVEIDYGIYGDGLQGVAIFSKDGIDSPNGSYSPASGSWGNSPTADSVVVTVTPF